MIRTVSKHITLYVCLGVKYMEGGPEVANIIESGQGNRVGLVDG